MTVYLVKNLWDNENIGIFSSKEKAINAMLKIYKDFVKSFPSWERYYEEDIATIKEDCELMDIFKTEVLQFDDDILK